MNPLKSHALLSASGADRWLNCMPSARLEEQFDEVDSEFSIEGTQAHEICELEIGYFLGTVSAAHYQERVSAIGAAIFDEIAETCQSYITYIIDRVSVLDTYEHTKLEVEKQVDFGHIVPDGFGTCDAVIYHNSYLEIIDFKYGVGVKVDAEDNSQLKLYALGMLYEMANFGYDLPDTVKLVIIQPRIGNISEYNIPTVQLYRWAAEEVTPTALKAFKGEGSQIVGKWCQFCKAKPKCAALHNSANSLEVLPNAEFQLISQNQIEAIYAKKDKIMEFLKAVESYMHNEMLAGTKFSNYKLVASNSRRTWIDEQGAIKALRQTKLDENQYLTLKLAGITTLEKLLGKNRFTELLDKFTGKPEGKPTIAPITDQRTEIGINLVKYFKEDLDEMLL